MNEQVSHSFAVADFGPYVGQNVLDPRLRWTRRYVLFKRSFDLAAAFAALPFLAFLAAVLLLANPVFNPGPLFFTQERMGKYGRRFRLIKFRTMAPDGHGLRAVDEQLDEDRITPLGRALRRTHLDEVPNFLNVLVGDISVVGPRPDAWDHALVHILEIPGYRERFRVRPGITGLAQVMGGYPDERRAFERKARLDLFYVKHSRIKLDLLIIWRTVVIMLKGHGAR